MPPENRFHGNLTFTNPTHQAQSNKSNIALFRYVREWISRIEYSDEDTSTKRSLQLRSNIG
ncbi:hypothetical protein V6Z11_D13G144900 [Gossypium hirsutum]